MGWAPNLVTNYLPRLDLKPSSGSKYYISKSVTQAYHKLKPTPSQDRKFDAILVYTCLRKIMVHPREGSHKGLLGGACSGAYWEVGANFTPYIPTLGSLTGTWNHCCERTLKQYYSQFHTRVWQPYDRSRLAVDYDIQSCNRMCTSSVSVLWRNIFVLL